jgi:hypothetical protein
MRDCLILTHGAGSNRDAPLLVALDDEFRAAGIEVVRMNLPFRERGPGSPRAGDPERDRAGLRHAVDQARLNHEGRVFLGGHSYGGRQSSMLAADVPELVDALLLLSYPLHPPRRPDQLRTAHLSQLQTPALFVHGKRDPFGSIEELTTAMALITGRTSLVEIPGAGHELVPRRAGALKEAAQLIARAFVEFVQLS